MSEIQYHEIYLTKNMSSYMSEMKNYSKKVQYRRK